MSKPACTPVRQYSMPSAMVKAISRVAVAPASIVFAAV